MTYAGKSRDTSRALNVAMIIVFLATVTLVVPKHLGAQRPTSTEAAEPGVLADRPNFTGSWRRDAGRGEARLRSFGFDETVACRELRDALGNPLERCSLPFDKLKAYLHPRALAWLQFADERLSSKWYCTPPTTPGILDAGTWTFIQVSGSEWRIDHLTPTVGTVLRTIYMDGRSHPSAIYQFHQGHTIGWFEGGDLVLETTNFTFDATGLEDHSLLPSSFLKKVTERYTKTAPDKVMLKVTHEDPLFLKMPYTWSFELVKSSVPEASSASNVCDPKLAELELETTVPDRYIGK